MEKLDNIQVFALCVADVMNHLFAAFPIPTELSGSRVMDAYGPTQEESKPRIVYPHDPDYTELFSNGYADAAGLSDAANETYSEQRNAVSGEPFKYWTDAQRQAVRSHRVRAEEAKRIYDATVAFLLREGYINDVPKPATAARLGSLPFVLTSKGFAHLNKKFEAGTIRDEFQYGTAGKVFRVVKGGGDVASAATSLVNTLSVFFS